MPSLTPVGPPARHDTVPPIRAGRKIKYSIGEGITGEVIQTGKPMVVPRVSEEPRFLNRLVPRPDVRQHELSYISAPITLDGQNLNNPTLKYYALNQDQPRAFYKNGAQYYLNFRFKL